MKYEQYLKKHNENFSKLEKDLSEIDTKIEALQLKKVELRNKVDEDNFSNFEEYKKQLAIDTEAEVKKINDEKTSKEAPVEVVETKTKKTKK